MKIASIGRLVAFIVIVGLAIGLYRLYAGHGKISLPSLPGGFFHGGRSAGGAAGDIALLTTPSKAGWLQDEVDAFNSANQGKYHIKLVYAESRQSMQDIINGKQRPVLWSPSSPIWIERLSEYSRQHSGSALVDPSDINTCRVFLRTPLVVITTRERAPYVRRIFESSSPWNAMRQIGLGRQRPPWGKLAYSHADPLVSNSGMLTLALMLNEYSARSGGDMDQTAISGGFIGFMSDIDRSLVYDQPARKGSQPLVDAYADQPSGRDFITAYESAALGAAASNADLAVVYPIPTIVSEQMVAILNASWVSPEQKQGAGAFLQMLASRDSLQRGITYNMRPASSQSAVSLAETLSRHSSQGFRQSFTSVEMPPYAALNDAAFQWRIHVAHMPAQ